MTKVEFLRDYYCNVHGAPNGVELTIITKIIRRNDNLTVDSVKTVINIHETNMWIHDMTIANAQEPIDLNYLIEKTKRFQLDYFAQRVPIVEFFPIDSNLNTADMYI